MGTQERSAADVRSRSPTPLGAPPELLRNMLVSSGLSAMLGGTIAAISFGVLRADLVAAILLGLVLLVAARRPPTHWRVAGAGYVIALLCLALFIGYHSAWAPAVVVLLCYLVVAAGLLFGGWGVYPIVAAVAVALVVGGILVDAGLYSVPLIPTLDPRNSANWVRVAILFVVLTGGAVWVLQRAKSILATSERAVRQALDETQRSIRDVDAARFQRRQHEDALRNAQKLQTVAQLGDGFAHVFNNVVTVVRCACEQVRESAASTSIQEAGRVIAQVATEAAARTQELLVLSRARQEEREPLRLDVELARMVPGLGGRLRANIALELETEPIAITHVPRAWLEQLLMNLLLNAEQAMPSGGNVTIRAAMDQHTETSSRTVAPIPPGPYVALTVTDRGLGMPGDVAARACEPFFTTKNRARHDGLGLTVVHGMAQRLGGSLRILSGDGGTTVTVLLPPQDGDIAMTMEAPTTGSSARRTSSPPMRSGHDVVNDPAVAAAATMVQAIPEEVTTSGPPSRSSRPRRPCDDVADWQLLTLNRVLIGAAVAFAVAFTLVALTVHVSSANVSLVALSVASVATLFAAAVKSLPFRVRRDILLGVTLLVGMVILVHNTFLDFGGVLLLALAAFLAAVLGGRWAAPAVLLIAAAAHTLGAVLWSLGVLAAPLEPLTGDSATNWYRMAVLTPVGVTLVALAVLHAFTAARQHLSQLEGARQRLESSRLIHQEELEATSKLEAARAAAARLEAAGRVTGMVAHDLNNSLQAMIGWTEMVVDPDSDEERASALESLERAADYMQALVEQLQLGISQVHVGPSLDLGREVGQMAPLLEAVVKRRPDCRVALTFRIAEGCHVGIQPHSLRRLVLNLVTNARDAIEASGTCCIQLERDQTIVRLVVSDDGHGMTEQTRTRLFDAFFTTKEDGGTGLGLHSVAEIVRACQGEVDVWSEPERGSRFTVTWPAAAPAVRPVDTTSLRPLGSGAGRLLLAEDNALVREQLGRCLERTGFDVVVARDTDEALEYVETRGPFDALCTDAIMPGASVSRLVERFADRFPDRPIVIISGYQPEDVAQTVSLTDQAILLRKPFACRQLSQELHRLLAVRCGSAGPG